VQLKCFSQLSITACYCLLTDNRLQYAVHTAPAARGRIVFSTDQSWSMNRHTTPVRPVRLLARHCRMELNYFASAPIHSLIHLTGLTEVPRCLLENGHTRHPPFASHTRIWAPCDLRVIRRLDEMKREYLAETLPEVPCSAPVIDY